MAAVVVQAVTLGSGHALQGKELQTYVQANQNSEANCRWAAGLIAVDTARVTRLQWDARSQHDCREGWNFSGRAQGALHTDEARLARAGACQMQRPAL